MKFIVIFVVAALVNIPMNYVAYAAARFAGFQYGDPASLFFQMLLVGGVTAWAAIALWENRRTK